MCTSGAIGRACAELSGCITISVFGVLYVKEWSDRSCMCGTIGLYNNLSLWRFICEGVERSVVYVRNNRAV